MPEGQKYSGPVIVEAKYGEKDVRNTLKKYYTGGLRKFKADHTLWGDADASVRKVLRIVYK